MASDHGAASERLAALRSELLSAFAREGICYPPERLDDAVAEYEQLKTLMKVVEAATRAPSTGKAL